IPAEEYRRRLENELEVINSMGFVNYYLIVWDFIRFARSQGIMVGPGRGSGAGSLAAYCLKITNIDPLKYGLIFERFLNVERVSMPDFDIDFCYERRGEVIDYVTEKYGADHVAQVITFGTLAARAVIRDVARALDVSYAETDRIAKLVPFALGITIEKALETSPELKHEYDNNPVAREVLDTAMRFEGMPRHASTHAAGVIIASRPITELAPLSRNDEQIVVQFDKNNVEQIGLLKFDFLGLRTLTVLRDTAAMVKENTGEIIDYDRIPMDDASVYKMIADGETDAVFQLESGGMTSFMKELRPESFEDIIAGISLFRPGPMEQIPRYVAGKHNPSTIHYDHPALEPILQVTYGCMVYQEQVMQIVRELAGFSLGQADNIRRAMSKKKPAEIAKYKRMFLDGGVDEHGREVAGAVARGVSPATAEKIFEEVMAFAGYAFNKSHAAAYAMVAYQTAWLKKHYPVEFMAAMLNSYMGDLSRAAHYVRTARKMGISVLPPDINCSSERFTTENGKIRFSLLAVKNVGEGAVRALINERKENGPFRTYGDFLRRVPEGEINRKMIESLIRASAFDNFEIPRSRLIAALDPFLNQLANSRKQSMEGQLSLFADVADKLDGEPNYPQIADFCRDDYLAMEKEMLGLYVSGHPLDEYEEAMRSTVTMDSTAFAAFSGSDEEEAAAAQLLLKDRSPVRVAGLVESRKNKTTRNNEMMSFVTLEDLYNTYEVIVFPRVFQASTDILLDGAVVLIDGLLSIREDEAPKVIANDIRLLDKDPAKNPPLPANYGNRGNGGGYANGKRKNDNNDNVNSKESNNNGNINSNSKANNDYLTKNDKTTEAAGRQPVLAIRFAGREGDATWERLLAMISYFSGNSPVCVYFNDGTVKDLDARWRVEISDEVMSYFARLYGQNNLALI
ncbi:MAG: DNA polymerase III subunit alpha, partial [Ruminococcaceae bacterium]|nr:DNA polymerase III subunit alpha [Oscillospiraceae bacterium]